MTSFRKTHIVIFLLLACLSCQSRKTPVGELQQRLTSDSIALHQLQERYQDRLQADFRWCDSMLQYLPEEQIDQHFQTLNLTQAYLGQFDEMLPVMQRDIRYARQQLTNLQNDIDTHYINDSLAAEYLADETAVVDTLHYRILYFQDRLSQQDKELKSLKKTISKATK